MRELRIRPRRNTSQEWQRKQRKPWELLPEGILLQASQPDPISSGYFLRQDRAKDLPKERRKEKEG